MLGKTENYGSADPWPINLPGENKPVRSDRIEEYLTNEFWHYYQFYINTKHCGQPYSCGWIEWPGWIPQLLSHFDNAIEVVKRDAERRAYQGV